MRRGRRTVAAQRRQSGKRVMPRKVKRGRETPMTPGERRRFFQVLVCGGIFVALVAVKLLLPGRMAAVREKAVGLLERNMDVQAVFSAVGRAFSGEGGAGEIYQAVFHPEEQEAIPAALTVTAAGEALELLHTYHVPPAETGAALPGVLYSEENLPEDVSLQQAILNFEYCTPVVGTLTSPFGYREHPIEGEDAFHYGVDLAAGTGTAIAAFAAGTVGAVGESSSYGKYCVVDHGGGYTTLYAHCDRILVSSGAQVTKGQTIAEVGSTGMATGSHLHFELLCQGVYLNPIYYVSYTAQV